jgi:hypothetical protein
MSRRSLVLGAVACGVVVAVVVALAVPTRSTGRRAQPAAQAQGPIVVLPRRPDKPARGQLLFAPQRDTIRIGARIPDPLGGPPFAVRVFRAARFVPYGAHPSVKHARLLGHDMCAQLGRIYRGRFGWLDARRRFRPANFNYFDTPILCGDRWRDDRSDPRVQLTTLISDPTTGTARTLQSVLWGFAGPLARRVSVTGVPGKALKLGAEGVFLSRAPREVRANELTARFTYRGRSPESVAFAYIAGTRGGPGGIGDRARAMPGTATVEARAPDPGGGLAWGILGYKTDRGTYCVTQPGRVVGNRVGSVNFVLGTFADIWDVGRQCGSMLNRLPPDWPIALGGMFGGGLTPQSLLPTEDPLSGRNERRTLPGRTVVFGVARPNVRELTLATPRDVRTLIPSKRAHAIIVVYDGTFPTGKTKVTATMADGSHQTVRQFAGIG